MKKIYLIILFGLYSTIIFCQHLNIECNFGYGFYNLNDLKKFQTELLTFTNNYPVKKVVNFPNYIFGSVVIDFKIANAGYLGINASILSTGARNQVKDYSGEVKIDLTLTGYKVGLNYKILFLSDSKLNFYLQMKGGIINTTLKMYEFFSLYQIDTTMSSTHLFKSNLPFIEPIVGLRYFIFKNIALNTNFSYEFDIRRNLIEENTSNEEKEDLTHNNGSSVNADWSGFRSLIGITIIF